MSERMRPLSGREKAGYGIGDFASNLYLGFFGLFLLYYYTDIYGISAAAAATIMLATRVVDAITDPIMGAIADRTRTKWGRYRPYLLFVSVPFGIMGYLTLAGPDGSETFKIVYALVTYMLVMMLYTAINLPYSALLGVISPRSEERTKATVYRFVMASLGNLFVALTATALVREFGNGDDLVGMRWTMGIFATIAVVSFLVCFATTRERIEAIPQKIDLKRDLGTMIKDGVWPIVAIGCLLLIVGISLRGSTAVFYFKYLTDYGDQPLLWAFDYFSVNLALSFVGVALGSLAVAWLRKRWTKRELMIGSGLLNAVLLVIFYFVPPALYWVITSIAVASGFLFGIAITAIFAIYTDVAEFSEWKNHRQVTALVIAASIFSMKAGGALGGAIPGFALGSVGFVPNVAQPGEVQNMILVVYTFVPAAAFLLSGVVFLKYPLDRTRVCQIEADLNKRRGNLAPA
ncbi:MFS transporter [Sphingomicrobium sediminis]|uniref:MFS transporter n=1 Tax=Sphingomicrobium sediminis TaxID=2950949 RepID=A0A9X2EEK1_9SPHN|nr:MFS transporter [Sphingomicrobium sediminis]MCM8556573.1 MFS transporter [Sphingomicrobium sediminis]